MLTGHFPHHNIINNLYLVNLHVFLQDFLGWQITWIPFPDSPKRVTGWGETL